MLSQLGLRAYFLMFQVNRYLLKYVLWEPRGLLISVEAQPSGLLHYLPPLCCVLSGSLGLFKLSYSVSLTFLLHPLSLVPFTQERLSKIHTTQGF